MNAEDKSGRPTVVFWGTYDTGKARDRLLLEGARRVGVEVLECHCDVWGDVSDKSNLGPLRLASRLFHAILAYPYLLWQYMRLPRHDVVCVLYMGQMDVLAVWLATRIRGVPLVWDMYISLYDTVTGDRDLAKRDSALGRLIYGLEWMSCRAADKVIIDTATHARYVEETFHLPTGSVERVFIGTDLDLFADSQPLSTPDLPADRFNILFFGQFIPLHGTETILRAAAILESRHTDCPYRWILAGRGQESERMDALIRSLGLQSVKRKEWIPHQEIPRWIRTANLSLGIFGTTGKATRVIPNKVFEIIATRRPFVTADTEAMRELDEFGLCRCISKVPPGDPTSLADKIEELRQMYAKEGTYSCHNHMRIFGTVDVGEQLLEVLLGVGRARQSAE